MIMVDLTLRSYLGWYNYILDPLFIVHPFVLQDMGSLSNITIINIVAIVPDIMRAGNERNLLRLFLIDGHE